MDKVIVTALLVVAGVTAAGVAVATLTPVMTKSSTAVVEKAKDTSDKIGTDVKIIMVHPDSVKADAIQAFVKNVGSVNIIPISESNIYIENADGSAFYAPPYNAVAGDNTWQFTPAVPIYLGPGETMTIDIDLPQDLVAANSYVLTFITPNAITDIFPFGKK
jgi:archaellum component FlaG (FlaF/FlaG flagellin family)